MTCARSLADWIAGLALLAGLGYAAAAEPSNDPHRALLDYTQFCSGCHLSDGAGSPARGIPSMKNSLERFMTVPGGREYIVQVPGVMNSGLKDADVAQLMNWLVPRMSADGALASSPGYTADEIARLRRSRPLDIPAKRRALVQQLEATAQVAPAR